MYLEVTLSVCAFVLAPENLTVMLYLHSLYNVDKISIYAIKVTGQTTSSVHVQILERSIRADLIKSVL